MGMNPIFLIFGIFFTLALLFILFQVFKNIRQWHRNNQAPRETQKATIVTKRTEVNHHMSNTNNNDTVGSSRSSTTYYATFEFQNGERLELTVKGNVYGQLAEGDNGYLTFQGTRFVAFERNRT
ncbi:DUF2500 family protein [Vagococcus zengguangii]|uniref:DUF2500 domain-containing protein n=2 Tax=Vagococcus zengguangii TaxID=2571750 RepID=A0A4D7CTN7_9ENTE|nr:DUF2500 domain-containing protein [Vagococcus zengguangii]TLG81840.1 DUF2500 family protein [Vagococcus zengguangii]